MFTGIIEQTGTLVSLTDRGGVRRITVEAPGIANRLREGDSLAVSGVCLTALDVDPKYFHADLAQETLDRTSLGELKPGAKVNLELPTAAGSPLGGHVVQGHVDGAGTMTSLEPVIPATSPNFNRETTDWTLKVRIPENLRQWMVHKGSVAIEGIDESELLIDLLLDATHADGNQRWSHKPPRRRTAEGTRHPVRRAFRHTRRTPNTMPPRRSRP